jgi:hypothetical protein
MKKRGSKRRTIPQHHRNPAFLALDFPDRKCGIILRKFQIRNNLDAETDYRTQYLNHKLVKIKTIKLIFNSFGNQ